MTHPPRPDRRDDPLARRCGPDEPPTWWLGPVVEYAGVVVVGPWALPLGCPWCAVPFSVPCDHHVTTDPSPADARRSPGAVVVYDHDDTAHLYAERDQTTLGAYA